MAPKGVGIHHDCDWERLHCGLGRVTVVFQSLTAPKDFRFLGFEACFDSVSSLQEGREPVSAEGHSVSTWGPDRVEDAIHWALEYCTIL